MTDYILATPEQHDLSITYTFYDNRKQKVRRTFHLRNLLGDNFEQHLEEAQSILNQVAAELYHITDAGIDKGEIKAGRKKIHQEIYPDYTPQEQHRIFRYGVNIGFPSGSRWRWVNTERGGYASQLSSERINETWQRRKSEEYTRVSFTLPCFTGHAPYEDNLYFFQYVDDLKRTRRTIGWRVYYDQKDEIFNRFIRRFLEAGNLCIGDKKYWTNLNSDRLEIKGIFWPVPKFDKTPHPQRKSRLASQPTDDTEYVYLIRMGRQKVYKIGKSNDPQGRLASLQSASPYKLKLYHTFRADNASAAEETLHVVFHSNRLEGEWFQLSDEQKKAVMTVVEFKEGQFHTDKGRVTAEGLAETK